MISPTRIFAMAVAAILATGAANAAECDIKLGKKQFRKCRACHKLDDGKNGIGPHLFSVVDRKIAAVEGFRYSKAMKKFAATGAIWDAKLLDTYLTKPRALVKGTRMSFAGIRKPDQRAAVICYLATFK